MKPGKKRMLLMSFLALSNPQSPPMKSSKKQEIAGLSIAKLKHSDKWKNICLIQTFVFSS
jgi:hypothetical protein